jgi:hypothetical protein
MKILNPHFASLSEDSQAKLSAGNALRILESKFEQDSILLADIQLPEMRDYVNHAHQEAYDESITLF